MDKLQSVLNAAARVVTGTRKFDRGLGQILHDEFHWLNVPDRVFFKLAVIVHRCLNAAVLHCTCRTTVQQPSTSCSTSLPAQHPSLEFSRILSGTRPSLQTFA